MINKGQQSLEGVMIFGWSIIIIILALGTLTYFGVLDLKRFAPDSCTLNPGLVCNDASFSITGNSIALFVTNRLGEDITIQNINITDANCAFPGQTLLDDGSSQILEMDCGNLSNKKRINGEILGTYQKGNNGLQHQLKGKIVLQTEK